MPPELFEGTFSRQNGVPNDPSSGLYSELPFFSDDNMSEFFQDQIYNLSTRSGDSTYFPTYIPNPFPHVTGSQQNLASSQASLPLGGSDVYSRLYPPSHNWQLPTRGLSISQSSLNVYSHRPSQQPTRGRHAATAMSDIQLFQEAMKRGHVMCRTLNYAVTGVAGTGKTHTVSLILNEDPPEERHSTGLLNSPIRAISSSLAIGSNPNSEMPTLRRAKEGELLDIMAISAKQGIENQDSSVPDEQQVHHLRSS